jgi:hypothetical protein
MSWAGKQHPVEAAIEWLTPIPLALAVGWAGPRFGLSLIVTLVLGILALIGGFAAFRLGGGSVAAPGQGFVPTQFAPVEPDELLLEEKDAVLELNDRLEEVDSDSRVVRLFERQEPTPGELVDRIVDFLGDRRPSSYDVPAPGGHRPDASAALHDALAKIRASLR